MVVDCLTCKMEKIPSVNIWQKKAFDENDPIIIFSDIYKILLEK